MIGGQYRLIEAPTEDYLQRTEMNVRGSDGTVVFTLTDKLSGGSLRTMEFCRKHKKPVAHISRAAKYKPAEALQRFVQEHKIKTLNVAGTRESKEPGIGQWVYQVVEDAFFWEKAHPGMLGGPGEG